MDNETPDTNMGGAQDEFEEGEEEVEVTREELVAALKEVVTDLSNGLKGPDRDAYLTADDLAQNDWFFAGVSETPGQFAITMWPAEGDEDMLRIDLGGEEDVQNLTADDEQIEALTDDFIEGMTEEYEEDFDEDYEEEEEEESEEEEGGEEEEEYEDEYMEEEEEDEGGVSSNGHTPGR